MIEQILAWDSQILLFIQNNIREPMLTPVVKMITHLGDAGIFWILLTLALLIWPRTRRIGWCSACALIGSVLVNNLFLKNAVARTRPYEVIQGLQLLVGRANDYSFPSGHSAASFAASVAIYRSMDKKGWGIAGLVLAALIALSRLYVGIHYPTDVLGGALIGILLGIYAPPIGDWLAAKWKRD